MPMRSRVETSSIARFAGRASSPRRHGMRSLSYAAQAASSAAGSASQTGTARVSPMGPRYTAKMSRAQAILAAERYFDEGRFFDDLARRVAIPTESQNPARRAELERYLESEIAESLERMGFACRIVPNPAGYGPFLIAERIEDQSLPTVLSYAHGDVIRGQEGEWRAGLDPWKLAHEGERIYGRGTADNKGQHTINFAALEAVLRTRGRLGFNVKLLVETGEEVGSPGLKVLCEKEKNTLRADVFIASDGPRLQPGRPRPFLRPP